MGDRIIIRFPGQVVRSTREHGLLPPVAGAGEVIGTVSKIAAEETGLAPGTPGVSSEMTWLVPLVIVAFGLAASGRGGDTRTMFPDGVARLIRLLLGALAVKTDVAAAAAALSQ